MAPPHPFRIKKSFQQTNPIVQWGRAQFLAAIAYIYRENPTAAVAFRHKAEKALSRLQKFPQSGRVLPEFPDLPFREVIVTPYRFFYRVKEKNVWIVAV